MNAKCIILDYHNGMIRIIDIDNMIDSEEIERLLTEQYEFELSEIDWMLTRNLIIEF